MIVWIFIGCLLFPLGATDIVFNVSDLPESFPSSANPLWAYQGQTVQVRGFWYALPSGHGILAPTPNLKSCCIGTPAKVTQQLIVRGTLPSSYNQQAVAVEGIFNIEPLYDAQGKLVQLYVLDSAQRLEGTAFPWFSILLLGIFCLFPIRAFVRYKYFF